MSSYNKFEGFVGYLGLAAVNLNTDTFRVYLTNATPSTSADDVKADLATITEENGYAAADITNTYAEVAGTGTVTVVDVVWTASGGSFGPGRYAPVYDDTHASDILCCWWDYGSSVTVNVGETFTVDFAGNSLFTLA